MGSGAMDRGCSKFPPESPTQGSLACKHSSRAIVLFKAECDLGRYGIDGTSWSAQMMFFRRYSQAPAGAMRFGFLNMGSRSAWSSVLYSVSTPGRESAARLG